MFAKSSTLTRLNRALDRFSQFDPNMQLSTIQVLLFIARNQDREGGISVQEVRDGLGMSNASASRNVNYWTDVAVKSMTNAGAGLVVSDFDLIDRRRRVLHLSPKGVAFLRQVEELLNG